jgi:hypothetical protein
LKTEGRCWLSGFAYRLGKNGQTVYTICFNIGSSDLQAVSGEINYVNVNDDAYAPDIDDNDEEAKQAYVGDSEGKEKQASLGGKEGVGKQASVARSFEFSDKKDYNDTIKVDSDKEFWLSFPRDRKSRSFFLGGTQKSDTMGIVKAEEEATINQYRTARKSFTDKERLSLMKSCQIKALPHCLRKASWEILKVIRVRWFDQLVTCKVIVYPKITHFN